MTIEIRALQPSDRAAWAPLWAGYQRFYEVVIPPETTDLTWSRFHDASEEMYALGAFDGDGRLVGISPCDFSSLVLASEMDLLSPGSLCRR